MKKLLLIVLLLSQPIYAHGNDYLFRQEAIEREIAEFEAANVQPWQIGCGIGPLLPQEAIEKEIAEFEANLAKELADKAA